MICADYHKLIISEKLMNKNWEKALVWLRGEDWKHTPLGKTEIDGSEVYATRSVYISKPPGEGRYESHRLYADIQMVIRGTEIILVCNREKLTPVVPYSQEEDTDFLEGDPPEAHRIILTQPSALVIFPWDAHKPGISFGENPSEVEKLVVKVALN